MNVLIYGQRGMLGHVVARYLAEHGHQVIDGGRYDGALTLRDAEAVVNCAGVLSGERGMYLANALLPLHLAARLDGRPLIHASTDCVFTGDRGWYRVDEPTDAQSDYGLSKRLGEGCLTYPNVFVLRTSIVGPPGDGGRGLLGWFLGQQGRVDGWTDHVWNGITTLAWAELARLALEDRLAPGLHQPTTAETITKCEMLRLFGEVFDHRLEVREVTGIPCDRSLVPTMAMAPLREQLHDLKAWMV